MIALRASLLSMIILVAATASADVTQPLVRLRAERAEAASAVYATVELQYRNGTTPLDAVYLWSVRWYESVRDAGEARAAAAHLARMEKLADGVRARVQSGAATRTDDLACAYYRAEAQLWAATPAPPRR